MDNDHGDVDHVDVHHGDVDHFDIDMVTWTMMDLHLRIAIISKQKGPTMMSAIRADPSLKTQVLSQIRPYKEFAHKKGLSFFPRRSGR